MGVARVVGYGEVVVVAEVVLGVLVRLGLDLHHSEPVVGSLPGVGGAPE